MRVVLVLNHSLHKHVFHTPPRRRCGGDPRVTIVTIGMPSMSVTHDCWVPQCVSPLRSFERTRGCVLDAALRLASTRLREKDGDGHARVDRVW